MRNDGIYYNAKEFIPIENTNLPYDDIKFYSESRDVFWEVELLKYDKVIEELQVKITDYNPDVEGTFSNQDLPSLIAHWMNQLSDNLLKTFLLLIR